MDELQRAEAMRRLDNWGAWARSGFSAGPRRCGSAEGRYVPKRDDDGERIERAARMPIDVADAERVEAAVLSIRNHMEIRILVWHFVYRYDQKYLAKKLNCRPMYVEPYVLRAIVAMQYRLDHQPAPPAQQLRRRGLQSGFRSNMYEVSAKNEGTAA